MAAGRRLFLDGAVTRLGSGEEERRPGEMAREEPILDVAYLVSGLFLAILSHFVLKCPQIMAKSDLFLELLQIHFNTVVVVLKCKRSRQVKQKQYAFATSYNVE